MDEALEAHMESYLGPGVAEEQVGGVALWCHERPEFVSWATHGLSDTDVATEYPQEIVCSVEHGQDGAAHELVLRTLELVLEQGQGLVDQQLIVNDRGPLLEATRIVGVLVGGHPRFADFDVVLAPDGSVRGIFEVLVPITEREAAQADADGVEAMIDAIARAAPPLLDVMRS